MTYTITREDLSKPPSHRLTELRVLPHIAAARREAVTVAYRHLESTDQVREFGGAALMYEILKWNGDDPVLRLDGNHRFTLERNAP